MPRALIMPLLALTSCELEELPTAASEHVVYHWNAGEHQLCGGTVAALDRHVELMTSHYGWPSSEKSVEYFWNPQLALSVCSGVDELGCARRFSSSTMVFSPAPVDTHEIGHTTRVGADHSIQRDVDFIEEGFAVRWTSAILELTDTPTTSATFLSVAELRAALDTDDHEDFGYGDAFTWWLALELEYGPAKMAELVAAVEGVESATGVDLALQRVLGLSLAQSAALAEALPSGRIDDPLCAFEGLPTFSWTGGPLVLGDDDASCDDEDIVNTSGRAALRLFAIEFPDLPTPVEVSVTVPEGEDPLRKALHLTWCSGEYHLAQFPPTLAVSADTPATPWKLSGRFVGALRGPLAGEGSVALPRATFK